jgi:hypothetical protein
VRPESYGCTVQETTYWSGGSGVRQILFWVDGACGAARMETETLCAPEPHGRGNALALVRRRKRACTRAPWREQRPDDLAAIPTYEDVLALGKGEILSAGYEQKNGWSCVWPRRERKKLETPCATGYLWKTGSSVAAELRREGVMTYAVSVASVQIPAADETVFCLPDGTDVEIISAEGDADGANKPACI